MSYERCAIHNLMRCPMCARADKSREVLAAAAPVHLVFNPEDLLDGPAAPAPPVAEAPVAAVPDAQALEALARQQEILAKRGELDGPLPDIVVADVSSAAAWEKVGSNVVKKSNIVVAAQEFALAESELANAEARIKIAQDEYDRAVADRNAAITKRDQKKAELQALILQ